MNKYELMTIYPIEEDKYKDGSDKVKAVLAQFSAQVEKEEPFGDRDLAYEINKTKRGRFVLFTIKVSPAKIAEINSQFRLNGNLLKYLFVKINEKQAK